MNYSLIQYADVKAKKLSEELESDGTNLYYLKKSPILSSLEILIYIFSKGRPNAIIFRYLNDYPSFIKTLLRSSSEFSSVFIAKLFKIKTIWICHNVDKESKENYPPLTKIRRNFFAKTSKKILVTDQLLIEEAKRQFYKYSDKIDYITFGPHLPIHKDTEHKLTDSIIEFITNSKEINSKQVLIGLCVSSPNEKNKSYEEAVHLLNASEKTAYKVILIFVGEISEIMRRGNEESYKLLYSHPDVLIVDRKTQINERELDSYIDFYWRVYDDQSVPFTVYNAATLGKPILTKNDGFLGEMVMSYQIGRTILSYNDLDEVLSDLLKWKDSKSYSFLNKNNWKVAAERLNNSINS